MSDKHQVHNLIILDESGSMQSIKNTILQGFNELVQSIKAIETQFPEQEHFISMVSFNSNGTKELHFAEAAQKLKEMDAAKYQPDALTPLYDAMGMSINKLKDHINGLKDYNVLVTVLTDGMENHSREYTGPAIKKLIEELKQQRWTFTYMGTDHDVTSAASNLSIDNAMAFDKNTADIEKMFAKDRQARKAYSHKIMMMEDTATNYFDVDDED